MVEAMRAFEEGAKAFSNFKSELTNPYNGCLAVAWRLGWYKNFKF